VEVDLDEAASDPDGEASRPSAHAERSKITAAMAIEPRTVGLDMALGRRAVRVRFPRVRRSAPTDRREPAYR
jgi:hypothetical protein